MKTRLNVTRTRGLVILQLTGEQGEELPFMMPCEPCGGAGCDECSGRGIINTYMEITYAEFKRFQADVASESRAAVRAAALLGRKGGKVGGLTTGATKARGDSDYYRELAARNRCRWNYAPNTYCNRRKGHVGPCKGRVGK